jgi:hypothetical protein
MKHKQHFAASVAGWITGLAIIAIVFFSIIAAAAVGAGKLFGV